jgi:predicted RNase H-like HicB family nuclease
MKLLRLFCPQKDPRYIKREYNIPDTINWDIQLNKDGLVATSKDLPGLITNADSPEELLDMINDAVLEYFDVPKLDSDYIFDKLSLEGHGEVCLKLADRKNQYA